MSNQGETMVRVPWYSTKKGKEEISRAIDDYSQAVNKSEGFDVSGLGLPPRYCRGLLETICSSSSEDGGCSRLVLLYARLGLHRYNLLQGKNLQLSSVKKYNQSTGSAASMYYLTLEAACSSSLQTFQIKVSELKFGNLVLSCTISRPLGETDIGEIIKRSITHKPMKNFFLVNTMPQWPTQNPFQNSNRCCVLKKSELKENDWIRLYLELAVATTNRGSAKNHDLSNLKILKVAIDTNTQVDVDEALYPKDFAIVYIRYKDTCEARVGKDSDRVAIIRRFFNQRMGCFSIVGQNLKVVIPKKKKKKKKKTAPQLLFSTRLRFKPLLKGYKYSGLGLSRQLRKARSSMEYVVVNEQLSPSRPRQFKPYNDVCSVHHT